MARKGRVMQPWEIILWTVTVLLAVLTGILIPVLLQLWSTLRSARDLMERVGPKLDRTLNEVQEASRSLRGSASQFEQGVTRARALLDAAGDVGVTLKKLNRSLATAATIGGAVGPAVAAAVRAFADDGPGAYPAEGGPIDDDATGAAGATMAGTESEETEP